LMVCEQSNSDGQDANLKWGFHVADKQKQFRKNPKTKLEVESVGESL